MAETQTKASTAANTDYISNGNNSEFVNLIKEGAVFQFEVGKDIGTIGPGWTPPTGTKPFGYFSEDGITFHPESGDTNDFTAHNGDVVLSWGSGGYWTIAFSGLESKKIVVETYFDTERSSDGGLIIASSECAKPHQYVVAGLTQDGKVMLIHIPKAKVGEREDFVWKSTELVSYGMTLRTFKDVSSTPYHFKAFGLEQDVTA